MNWTFLISFGIGLGVYLSALLIFGLIKRHKNKKMFDKDVKEHLNENGNNDEAASK